MNIEECFMDWRILTAPAHNKHYSREWLNTNCPYCGQIGSTKFHLGFHRESWHANCWQCGKKNAYDAIRKLAPHVPTSTLSEAFGKRNKYIAKDKLVHTGHYQKPETVAMRRGHHEYLIERGLDSVACAEQWKLEGTLSNAPKWKGLDMRSRIFIPIIVDGKPVSWTTRSIQPKNKMRYIAAPKDCEAVNVKNVAFGLDHPTHTAIIVEGPFDAMRIGPGAVATCGTDFKAGQIRRLGRFMRKVIVFDNSKIAQEKADQLANELAAYPGETLVVTIDGEDPASAPESEIIQLREAFL